jgi:hypothetical protein
MKLQGIYFSEHGKQTDRGHVKFKFCRSLEGGN